MQKKTIISFIVMQVIIIGSLVVFGSDDINDNIHNENECQISSDTCYDCVQQCYGYKNCDSQSKDCIDSCGNLQHTECKNSCNSGCIGGNTYRQNNKQFHSSKTCSESYIE